MDQASKLSIGARSSPISAILLKMEIGTKPLYYTLHNFAKRLSDDDIYLNTITTTTKQLSDFNDKAITSNSVNIF